MKFVLLTLEGLICHTVLDSVHHEAEHNHGFAGF